MPGRKWTAGGKLYKTCWIYESDSGTAGTYRSGTAFHGREDAGGAAKSLGTW